MHKERESISLMQKKEKWKHMRQKTIMKGLMKQYFINARCIRPRRTYKLGSFFKAITLDNSLLLCDVINQLAHTSLFYNNS
jgi:hypothetical protein